MKKVILLLVVLVTIIGMASCVQEHSHTASGEPIVVKEATCSEEGEAHRICSECNEVLKIITIDKTNNHKEKVVEGIEATCSSKGLTDGKKCAECGLVIVEQSEIPQIAHSYDDKYDESCNSCGFIRDAECAHNDVIDIPAQEATCTKSGLTAGSACARCEEILVPQTAIEPNGHTEVVLPRVEATFSRDGLTEGLGCSKCDHIFVAQTTIPALGELTDAEIYANANYYRDDSNSNSYSYSLSVSEKGEFVLTTLTITDEQSCTINYDAGILESVDGTIFELHFDHEHEPMYIRFEDGEFEFCKKDGSSWHKHRHDRPKGETLVSISPREGNSSYGYYDLANNEHGEAMQELYYRLYYSCEAFVMNDSDIKKINGLYPLDTINLSNYVITVDEAIAVWKVFYMENPMYYWLSNSITVVNGRLNLFIDEDYADADYRSTCNEAINNMAEECDARLNSQMSELEKSLTIHNFIIGRMDYAYESDGVTPEDDIWAHNLVGCAKNSLGVCESYAKTYLYLCLINDIDCIIVTGQAKDEEHGWNLVNIDDEWYGVDCTWDETNNSDEIAYNFFGLSDVSLKYSHTADTSVDYGVKYLYDLPDVSDRSIELVELYEDGNFLGTFSSIDIAFEFAVKPDSEYTIKLYDYHRSCLGYEFAGFIITTPESIVHQIFSEKTPDVNHLTIVGHTMEKYVHSTEVDVLDTLVLCSDFTVENICFSCVDFNNYATIDLKSHCMQTTGRYVDFSVYVIGDDESRVVCDASYDTTFWNFVRVDDFIAERSVYFRGSVEINNLHSRSWGRLVTFMIVNNVESAAVINNFYGAGLSVRGKYTLTIDNINRLEEYPSDRFTVDVDFDDVDNYPEITIKESELSIKAYLTGHTTYFSYDLEGNYVEWVESCQPSDLNKPILYLDDVSLFDDIVIEYVDLDYYTHNYTDYYYVDEQGRVLYKG